MPWLNSYNTINWEVKIAFLKIALNVQIKLCAVQLLIQIRFFFSQQSLFYLISLTTD